MRIKKNVLYIGVVFVLIVLAILVYYFKFYDKGQAPDTIDNVNGWSVDENGYISYSNRSHITFKREGYGVDGNISIHKIIYQSKDGNVYGLLVLPATAAELLPGIILLPGAGVSKESELKLAKKIAMLDAVVLVIDQRGTGETNGYFPNLDEDFASFIEGKEPVQHLMVYDALRAFDLLYSAPFVDQERIMIAGESLGGRIAVIAAALERKIKGALVISSAGFDFKDKGDKNKDKFLKSIDSDHYIGLIAPRKLVMIHNLNDSIIPLSSAVNSFSKAQEPKQFVLVNDTTCNHGYCESMYDGLVNSLDYLVDIRAKTILIVENPLNESS